MTTDGAEKQGTRTGATTRGEAVHNQPKKNNMHQHIKMSYLPVVPHLYYSWTNTITHQSSSRHSFYYSTPQSSMYWRFIFIYQWMMRAEFLEVYGKLERLFTFLSENSAALNNGSSESNDFPPIIFNNMIIIIFCCCNCCCCCCCCYWNFIICSTNCWYVCCCFKCTRLILPILVQIFFGLSLCFIERQIYSQLDHTSHRRYSRSYVTFHRRLPWIKKKRSETISFRTFPPTS